MTVVPGWTSSRVVGRIALRTAAGVSLAYILLPMFFVIWLAFFAQEIPSFPPEGYSLKWFRAVPGNDRFVNGFLLSLQVAVVATSIGLAIGVPAAVCLVRGRFAGREAVNNLLLLPLIVPGIVLGIALYVFHVETEIATGWPILGSLGGLIAGHVLIAIPWTVRLITASLVGMDRAVEEAAQSLGADRLTTFRRITLPAILPGIVAAALVRLHRLVRQSGNEPVPGRSRPHHAADRDPAISRMEDRSDHRGGLGAADPVYRRRDAGDRSLRQDRPRGLTMARLQLTGITKRYGDFKAVDDVSLDIADGEFLVLLGPSGCGKTTTLRIVAGFIEPTVRQRAPRRARHHRAAAVEAQRRPGVPELRAVSAHDGGRERRVRPRDAQDAEGGDGAEDRGGACAWCGSIISATGCRGNCPAASSSAWRWPARWCSGPTCCCSTSRLSNLDAKLRQDVRVEIRELQRKLGLTTVMVTHDQEEALTMADRLVVMSEGRIRQIGSQQDLYERPVGKIRRRFRRPLHLHRRPHGWPRALRLGRRPRRRLRRQPAPAAPRWRCARNGWR